MTAYYEGADFLTYPLIAVATGKLPAKRQRFVEEYLIDLNGAAAYRRAGYAVKNDRVASVEATRLLANPNVSAAIQEAIAARSSRTEITTDQVLRELGRLGFSDPRRLFNDNGVLLPMKEWPDDVAAAIASVEVFEEYEGRGESRVFVGYTKKLKLWDKNSALEKIGKHLGMFKEYHEHSGPDGGPIPAKVTHDVAADLAPYADVFRAFAAAAIGGGGGAVSPNGSQQPVDTAQTAPQAGVIPAA